MIVIVGQGGKYALDSFCFVPDVIPGHYHDVFAFRDIGLWQRHRKYSFDRFINYRR
jgi:hypothetical protein